MYSSVLSTRRKAYLLFCCVRSVVQTPFSSLSLFSLSLFHSLTLSLSLPHSFERFFFLCFSSSHSSQSSTNTTFLLSFRNEFVSNNLLIHRPCFLSFHSTKTTYIHMELDESPASAPTSRLDHLAELATSPTHAHPSVSSSSSSSSFSSFAASNNSNNNNTSSSPEKEHSFAHKHSHSHSHSESLMNESSSSHSRSHILESESSSNWKSPITPTTTRKFNRMAIHGVLEGTPNHPPHPLDDGSRSPPYKRKGSPDESFSDPPSSR
ncbi:MAG: hypothetical protein BYD32DRAFT_240365 [Podila humilis]|nr:MAG: hypothetical protein BYD32DRAFT_240365 [Podila humilis]